MKPPRRSQVPRGLLGMLVAIAAVEMFVAARHLDFTTIASDDWRRTAHAAVTKAKDRDILCFGDSLVKYGVLPRVIELETGLSGFNLAVNGGPMPAEYFLLRQTLAAGARPRAIIADFFPLMLTDTPRSSTRVYPELATLADMVDLAWTARDAGLLGSLVLGKVVPSVRCRFEIRNAVLAALGGTRASPWPSQRRIWTTWHDQLGAQPMPVGPGQPAVIPGLVADLTPAQWTLDSINAHYFEHFVALAEAHAIPIFWLIPPLGPEVEAGRVARGTALAYTRFARDAQDRHRGLIVLDARGAGYDGPSHTDPIHLNEAGATILSRTVAHTVRDHLSGNRSDRWANLPPYPNRTEIAGRRTAPVR